MPRQPANTEPDLYRVRSRTNLACGDGDGAAAGDRPARAASAVSAATDQDDDHGGRPTIALGPDRPGAGGKLVQAAEGRLVAADRHQSGLARTGKRPRDVLRTLPLQCPIADIP